MATLLIRPKIALYCDRTAKPCDGTRERFINFVEVSPQHCSFCIDYDVTTDIAKQEQGVTSRNLTESALTTISHHRPADLPRHCNPDSRVLLDVPEDKQGEERRLES
jgi:hypothetical protein